MIPNLHCDLQELALKRSSIKTYTLSYVKLASGNSLYEAESSLVGQMGKYPPAMWETWVRYLGQEDPRRRDRLPTPISLPRESHGQRSLAGCSPQGCKELDTTEQLSLHRELKSGAL